MRVFVTGATGWVGSAVVQGPHRRRPSGARPLPFGRQSAGPRGRRRRGSSRLPSGSGKPQERRRAVGWRDPPRLQPRLLEIRGERRGRAARHRGDRRGARRLRPAAGRHLRASPLLTPGSVATEETPPRPRLRLLSPQPGSRRRSAGARGVRATAVRLPPSVHGHGDHGFVPGVIASCPREGRLPLYWRWSQPLAGRAPARCGSRLSARPRARRGRGPIPCGRRRGRAIQRDRRGDRPATERSGRLAVAGRGGEGISAGSPGSRASTAQPRAREPGRCSAGSPSSPGLSPTSIIRPISLCLKKNIEAAHARICHRRDRIHRLGSSSRS